MRVRFNRRAAALRPALAGLLALVVLLAAGVFASPAPAGTQQSLILEDEHRLLEFGHQAQLGALDEMQTLGADKVRAVVWWRYMLAHPNRRARRAEHGQPSLRRLQRQRLGDARLARARGSAPRHRPYPRPRLGLGAPGHPPPPAALGEEAQRRRPTRSAVRPVRDRPRAPLQRRLPPAPRRAGAAGGARVVALERAQQQHLPAAAVAAGRPAPDSLVAGGLPPPLPALGPRPAPHGQAPTADLLRRDVCDVGSTVPAPLASMAPGLFVRELACVGSDIEPLRRGRRPRSGLRPLPAPRHGRARDPLLQPKRRHGPSPALGRERGPLAAGASPPARSS